MPLFSVVVPTYNRPGLLGQALESVLRQTFDDFECIVVEDAPPVSSARVPNDGRFRLIRHEKNSGVAAARNTGLRHARGEFVTFLDDDDAFAENRLELVRTLVRHDRVVVCARRTIDGSAAHYRNLQGDVRDSILDGFTPHLGQTTVPRLACPDFDESYPAMQDVEWWLRLSHAMPVLSTPEVGYLMRKHDGVRHGNDKSVRAECSRQLLEQYEEYFATHLRAKGFRLERRARLEHLLGHRRIARKLAWRSVSALPRVRSLGLAIGLSFPTTIIWKMQRDQS